MKLIYIPLILILMTPDFQSLAKEKVDLIVCNAKVYTVDEKFSIRECFAVKNGKIVEVGSNELIQNKYQAKNILDVKGKFVYPGFIDAHCHFYHYGLDLYNVDLSGTGSFEEILKVLKEHHQKFPSNWIIGRGWDQNDWMVKEFPDKQKLDELFPGNPVILTRIDGHAIIVNSLALKYAGIDKTTKVEGGEIIQRNGEPTGVLIDNAINLVNRIIPLSSSEQKKNGLLQAQKNCFAVGLTTVCDAGLPIETIWLIDSIQKSGDLKMRVYAMLDASDKGLEDFFQHDIFKTDLLNVRSVKLYADGALGSRGACLLEPYTDQPNHKGLMVNYLQDLQVICEKAFKYGFQVNTHCIGDSAVRSILKLYGNILKKKNDLRWRIEHAQVVDPEDFKLFSEFNIIPSVQTTHATSDMSWAVSRLGEKRIKSAYAYKQLLSTNGWLPNGSDFPVESINPIYGIYATTARKDFKGNPENGFQMENALTREQALRASTIWAAKAAFEETEKGTIEPGKFADFIITDLDILAVKDSELHKLQVIKTFINGMEVFSK